MDFKSIDLLFPGESSCYQIPPFQRNFQWQIEQAHRLVHDINVAVHQDRPHWIGVALLAGSSTECPLKRRKPGHSCYDILDGQQRFLTLRIFLIAIIDEYVRITGNKMEGYPRKEFTDIQVHGLDQSDWTKLTNMGIMKQNTFRDDRSAPAIPRTYWYFRYLLLLGNSSFDNEETLEVLQSRKNELPLLEFWLKSEESKEFKPFSGEDLIALATGTLENLSISCLEHQAGIDEDVEVVFETLNSSREILGQFDLFRNYILIQSSKEGAAQRQLYKEYLFFGENSIRDTRLDIRGQNLDRFLYDYLIGIGAAKESGTVKADSTASVFKKEWTKIKSTKTVESFLEESFAPSMAAWLTAVEGSERIVEKESQLDLPPGVGRAIQRIENLSKGPFTPLTSRLLVEWRKLEASRSASKLVSDLHMVETFLARQVLAGEPFSPLRRMAMSACVQIFVDGSTSLAEWVSEHSPSDDRIRNVLCQSCEVDGNDPDPAGWLKESDLYQRVEQRQLRAIFDGITVFMEGFEHSARLIENPTARITGGSKISIEHLYPQKPDNWIDNLESWETSPARMDSRLHALGNITVLPFKVNQSLSNKQLSEKQKLLRDKGVPLFKINLEFLDATRWTHAEIDKRTKELTEIALEHWMLP